mmetsp:Transcript_28853/g.48959  ORF Transcript_28853/g.48959 Transcript_28853/m.48959 type:complete len:165 (+) Transcript_28853:213-707(+)
MIESVNPLKRIGISLNSLSSSISPSISSSPSSSSSSFVRDQAYFEIRREAVPLWILSHSGPSLSKLPGDTKASSGAQPQLASDLTTKKRATSGNVYPNIYFIPNYIQKHASIGEKLLECLAGMHVQVNQDVKLVAVNLRILEIRELVRLLLLLVEWAWFCMSNH